MFFAFAKLNCSLGGGGGDGGYCEVWRNPRSWHTVTRPGSTHCQLQHSDSDHDHADKWPLIIITNGDLGAQTLCSSVRWHLYSMYSPEILWNCRAPATRRPSVRAGLEPRLSWTRSSSLFSNIKLLWYNWVSSHSNCSDALSIKSCWTVIYKFTVKTCQVEIFNCVADLE